MLSCADLHEASRPAPLRRILAAAPCLALLCLASLGETSCVNPSGRAVPPWVPICSSVCGGGVCQVPKGTTRPSEGPCCPLGARVLRQGWWWYVVVVGLRVSSTLCLSCPFSALLSLWYLLWSLYCNMRACIGRGGGRQRITLDRHSTPETTWNVRAQAATIALPTVHSATQDVFWVLRLTGPSITGQV